jgi:hypothetical protein
VAFQSDLDALAVSVADGLLTLLAVVVDAVGGVGAGLQEALGPAALVVGEVLHLTRLDDALEVARREAGAAGHGHLDAAVDVVLAGLGEPAELIHPLPLLHDALLRHAEEGLTQRVLADALAELPVDVDGQAHPVELAALDALEDREDGLPTVVGGDHLVGPEPGETGVGVVGDEALLVEVGQDGLDVDGAPVLPRADREHGGHVGRGDGAVELLVVPQDGQHHVGEGLLRGDEVAGVVHGHVHPVVAEGERGPGHHDLADVGDAGEAALDEAPAVLEHHHGAVADDHGLVARALPDHAVREAQAVVLVARGEVDEPLEALDGEDADVVGLVEGDTDEVHCTTLLCRLGLMTTANEEREPCRAASPCPPTSPRLGTFPIPGNGGTYRYHRLIINQR